MIFGKYLCASLCIVSSLSLGDVARSEPSSAETTSESPLSLVMQVVGLTEIRVEYASPAASGRKAFPAQSPTASPIGAQGPARLSLSRGVKIGGRPLAAGAYSLFLLPEGKRMTLVVRAEGDRNGDGGEVARVPLASQEIPARERMTFIFSDTTDLRTRLDLEWGTTRLSVGLETDPTATSNAILEAHIRDSWRVWAGAARICLELGELVEASAVIEASLAMKVTWLNLWIKAQILAARDDLLGAYTAGERALALGQSDPNFSVKADIERSLETWRAKALP